MRKYLISGLIIFATATFGFNLYKSHQQVKFAGLTLANVEALADNESGGSDCHYINGYKDITLDPPKDNPDAPRHSYYDCCGGKVTGYAATGSCI